MKKWKHLGVLLWCSRLGPSIVTAAAQVAAMAWVRFLPWELPYAEGAVSPPQKKGNGRTSLNLTEVIKPDNGDLTEP